MSVIIEKDNGDIFLYCKGADNVLFEKMNIHKFILISNN